MISNNYDEILIGHGLIPLVRGIISLHHKKSVLLLEETRFLGECYHQDFISSLEINALKNLGKSHGINELINIDEFLIGAQVHLQASHYRLFISDSPFDNIRELIRKFPELLDQTDLDLLYNDNPETFNEAFNKELVRFEEYLSLAAKKKKQKKFELQGPTWFLTAYKRFCQFVNKDYSEQGKLDFKSLIHLLGIFGESKIKSFLPPEDLHFYFLRLLTPVYRINDYLLSTQLLHLFKSLGGDYKKSGIQDWKIENNAFKYIILKSFEGIVSGKSVLFFGHLPDGLSFHVNSNYPIFKKTQLASATRANDTQSKELIFITDENELGTDRPFRVLGLGNEFNFYHYPYPILPGTKPEFYTSDMKHLFKQDTAALGMDQVETKLTHHFGVTLDLRDLRDYRKKYLPVLSELEVDLLHEGAEVSGFQYWGVFKYRSFGLLAHCYGIQF